MNAKELLQATLESHTQELIDRATRLGFVVTIETVPLEPLAMGNHKMVGHVRAEIEREVWRDSGVEAGELLEGLLKEPAPRNIGTWTGTSFGKRGVAP